MPAPFLSTVWCILFVLWGLTLIGIGQDFLGESMKPGDQAEPRPASPVSLLGAELCCLC